MDVVNADIAGANICPCSRLFQRGGFTLLGEINRRPFNSTLSDFMNTQPQIVIPAGIAGIQTPWMDLSLPSMALDTRSRRV
jgi:hypothetical protein